MRPINISNDNKRNAQVGFELNRTKNNITMIRKDGKDYDNARFLKFTIDTEPETLLVQYGSTTDLAEAIIDSDPEVDMENVGIRLTGVRKIFLTDDDKTAYRVQRQEVVMDPEGNEKGMRKYNDVDSNINTNIPLRWSGKLIPKQVAIRKFAFTRKYQVKHINGLTYDFLYEMAKKLHESQSMMLIGSGQKGTGPVFFNKGGAAYRTFLEGRVEGQKYCLILHLTNLEVKGIS